MLFKKIIPALLATFAVQAIPLPAVDTSLVARFNTPSSNTHHTAFQLVRRKKEEEYYTNLKSGKTEAGMRQSANRGQQQAEQAAPAAVAAPQGIQRQFNRQGGTQPAPQLNRENAFIEPNNRAN